MARGTLMTELARMADDGCPHEGAPTEPYHDWNRLPPFIRRRTDGRMNGELVNVGNGLLAPARLAPELWHVEPVRSRLDGRGTVVGYILTVFVEAS